VCETVVASLAPARSVPTRPHNTTGRRPRHPSSNLGGQLMAKPNSLRTRPPAAWFQIFSDAFRLNRVDCAAPRPVRAPRRRHAGRTYRAPPGLRQCDPPPPGYRLGVPHFKVVLLMLPPAGKFATRFRHPARSSGLPRASSRAYSGRRSRERDLRCSAAGAELVRFACRSMAFAANTRPRCMARSRNAESDGLRRPASRTRGTHRHSHPHSGVRGELQVQLELPAGLPVIVRHLRKACW